MATTDSGLNTHHGRNTVIVTAVLGFLALFSVFLRIWSRRMRRLSLAVDDYLVMGAMILVIVTVILCDISIAHGGVGNHITSITKHQLAYDLKACLHLHSNYRTSRTLTLTHNEQMLIPIEMLYGISLALVKSSFMVLYLRLFGTRRSLRLTIWFGLAIIWAWGLTIVLKSFLLCSPIAYNWKDPHLSMSDHGGKCSNRNVAFVAAAAINIATDIMIMLVPVPHIVILQLRLYRKVGLVCVFSVGLVVSIISILRIVAILHMDYNDVTYTLCPILMWSLIEQELAIFVANLPLLRNIITKILPAGWIGSRLSRDQRSKASSGTSPDSPPRGMQASSFSDSSFARRQTYRSWSWIWENRDLEPLEPLPWSTSSMEKPSIVFTESSRNSSDAELARNAYPSSRFWSASGISRPEPAYLV